MIEIKGEHFEEGLSVTLLTKGKEIVLSKLEIENESKVRIKIPETKIPAGKYDLKLQNKRSKSSIYKEFLTIKERVPDWGIVKRSAVFPGWGEYYAGTKYNENRTTNRGFLYMDSFLLMSILYYETFKQLEIGKNEYQQSILISSLAAISTNSISKIPIGITGYNFLQKKHDYANKMYVRGKQVENALVAIYLIQLIDAYFLNNRINMNSSGISGIYFNMNKNRLSPREFLIPEKIIHFGYRFSF